MTLYEVTRAFTPLVDQYTKRGRARGDFKRLLEDYALFLHDELECPKAASEARKLASGSCRPWPDEARYTSNQWYNKKDATHVHPASDLPAEFFLCLEKSVSHVGGTFLTLKSYDTKADAYLAVVRALYLYATKERS